MRKSILFIGSYPPPYHGSSIYLQNITELVKKDQEFEILRVNCSDRKNDLTNMGKWEFGNVYYGLLALIKLIFCLIFKRVDIVYVPIAQNKLAFLRDGLYIIFSKILGAKVLIHLHGSYFLEFYNSSSFIFKRFINLVMKSCSGVIVLGDSLKFIFEKWFDNSKIFVLRNFIKLPILNSESSSLNHKEKDTVNITYLGNVVESKGIFQALEAVKILLNKGLRFNFNIIGLIAKDEFTNLGEKETESLLNFYLNQYKDNIFYYGQIKDVNEKFVVLKHKTDVFLFPSWVEGQPLVILEAMSCGLPIISTKNVGVIEETVIDGYNGILVEKKNVEQLAEAIETLVKNEELRKRMGDNSYKRYNENYTPKIHLQNFKEIVRKVTEINLN